jgi:ABC-type dipeptide/oligopeptide/nickel transport system permease subunit
MKRVKIELKMGALLLSFHLIWVLGWVVYCYLIKGTVQSSYRPLPDMRLELIAPLSLNYFLGTDVYGRSLLEILSAGISYSLGVGLLVSFLSASIGTIVGNLAAQGVRWVRIPCDMLINVIFVLPGILMAILFLSFIGQSFWGPILVLSLTGWPAYAKVVKTEVLRIKNQSYVECSVASGRSKWGIFFFVIFPGVLPVLLVHIILGMSGVIIAEASLGFLGLGGSEYSLGVGLSTAKAVLLEAPHVTIFFSLALAGLILALNLLGDGLRDYLDSKNY